MKTQASRVSLPAPTLGLVEDQLTAKKDPRAADVLENFIPTTRGLRVRGGTEELRDYSEEIKAMFSYRSGTAEAMFAATASSVYQASVASSDPVASGMTSGDWGYQVIGTSGGEYLLAVNGADNGQIYDGQFWNPLADEAVSDLSFDGQTSAFVVGETVTGGTSGATAKILGLVQLTTTTGTLKLGTITGTFQDDDPITSSSGAAVADGTASSASSLTITGVDTSDLVDVWVYQERLFFIEKNSLTVWYLPASSVGGAASDLSLKGVFRRGGKLVLGGTWSLDSGDGLDDKCVFVTDQGEVAVYSGTDPSSASTWGFEGRYDIGKPLGKRATMSAGGDLLIATDDGIVPISTAINKDPAALSLSAVSRSIRDTWKDEAERASGEVELHKWTEGNLLLAVFPSADRMLVANLQTGAWAVQTGWEGNSVASYNGDIYIGRASGKVMKLDATGTDGGDAFTAKVCWSFQDMGDPTSYKVPSLMRGSFFAENDFVAKFSVSTDYSASFPVAPSTTSVESTGLVWGSGNWGEETWARSVEDPRTGVVKLWSSVSGAGYTLAPMVQITSGGDNKLSIELISVDLLLEGGGRAS